MQTIVTAGATTPFTVSAVRVLLMVNVLGLALLIALAKSTGAALAGVGVNTVEQSHRPG